ncbi:hypothetical protein GJAV_G00222710 [Gymnothorax javanicus]|nr:hypothetical protein GJAV_G00222710 [Gymnothorax javanicus]
MGVPWPVYLPLLLAVLTSPCHLLQATPTCCNQTKIRAVVLTRDLTCFNDFINNITCTWNSSGFHPEEHCILQGELTGHRTFVERCNLLPVEGQGTTRSCHLLFQEWEFDRFDELPIKVTCENSTVAQYECIPRLCVKMHPPGKPVISKSNVSWSLGSPLSRSIFGHYFQLQFKQSEQTWENSVSWDRPGEIMSVELAEDKLMKGQLYDARVRVRPVESAEDSLKGMWSNWSPTATWRSEVGEPPVGDLTCFNDFINNITCTWNISGFHPEEHCILQGELTGHQTFVERCNLLPVEGQGTTRSCHLLFQEWEFDRFDELPIKVTCENSTVAQYECIPRLCVKMHPPGKPVISKSNVSWSLGSPHSRSIFGHYFQLQFKQSEQTWENAVSWDRPGEIMSVELAEDKLVMGQSYDARVRVRPVESAEDSLKGMWSNWSPTATWRSEVGEPPVEVPAPPSDRSRTLPDPSPPHQVTVWLVAAAVALLVVISCKFHRAGWVHKLKLHPVPSPSTYFHVLNSVHGGNFQKWLSPMFAPESFAVPQSFEHISGVEVKAKNCSQSPSEPAEQMEDSGSRSQGSYAVEVYLDHTDYRPVTMLSEEEVGVDGMVLQDTSLQICYSYEHLGGEPRQLDPGCKDWSEEEEEQEEELEEEQESLDDPQEVDPRPPLTVLPFSLPTSISISHFPVPPHVPTIPLLSSPCPVSDSATAPGSNNVSALLIGALGRSPFAEIEACSGDYMSLRSACSNKSC